jgi:predicted regulator of amino acid metabolism with ACT domain
MATKGNLYVYDSMECDEAILAMNAEALAKNGYEVEIVFVDDEEYEVNSVMAIPLLPTLKFENGEIYEGIKQIERFFKDCVLNKRGKNEKKS